MSVLAQHIKALEELRDDPFSNGGYMVNNLMYNYPDVLTKIDKETFLQYSKEYICSLLQNLHARFPHTALISKLGMLDPRNVGKATPAHMIELGRHFDKGPSCGMSLGPIGSW